MYKTLLFVILIITFPIWSLPLLVATIVDMLFFDYYYSEKVSGKIKELKNK